MSCDDYCCNHGCNQGRDCPARQAPAKVAKVGRKDYGKEPLRGSAWRRQLRYLAGAMLMTLAVMLVSAAVVALMPKGRTYNCSLAEFHPDYPEAVKRQCRELRKERTV